MNVATKRRFTNYFILFSGLFAFGLITAAPAKAYTNLGGGADSSCYRCHIGAPAPSVTVTGPTSAYGSGVHTFTVTVTAAPGSTNNQGFGLDFAVRDASGNAVGTIGPGTGTKVWTGYSGHITHNGVIPMVNGVGTATFTWADPGAPGTNPYYVTGTATAVNRDGTPNGDAMGAASTLPISVWVDMCSQLVSYTCYDGAGNHFDVISRQCLYVGCPPNMSRIPPPICPDGAPAVMSNTGWICVTTTTTTTTTETTTTTDTTTTTSTTTTTETTTTSTTPTTTMPADRYATPANLPDAAMYCGFCHGLTVGKWRVAQAPYTGAPTRHKPSGMSKDRWKRIIGKMMNKEGCPVPADEVNNLARYYASLKR